jgi:hypothetical protein
MCNSSLQGIKLRSKMVVAKIINIQEAKKGQSNISIFCKKPTGKVSVTSGITVLKMS